MSIERCGIQAPASLPVCEIQTLINECFNNYTTGILSLATDLANTAGTIQSDNYETRFDELFAVGPGCLDHLIHTLDVIYQFADNKKLPTDNISDAAIRGIFNSADNISKALLKCLQHLRLKHPRRLWDPKGFRNYGERYEATSHLLEVCSTIVTMIRLCVILLLIIKC